MATPRVLSRESDLFDAESRLGVERGRAGRKGRERKGVEAPPVGSPVTEAERLDLLKTKIARTAAPGEVHNEFQERLDLISVERYDGITGRLEGLRVEIQARLAAAGIAPEARAAYIARPADLKGAHVAEGEPSFVNLVRDYVEQKGLAQAEQSIYDTAAANLGLVEERPRGSGKRARQAERSALHKTQDALAQVLEGVVLKPRLTLEEAVDAHTHVAQALQRVHFPEVGTPPSFEERQCLVLLQYLYAEVERRVDEVRVREKRQIEVLARQIRLAEASGISTDVNGKKVELRTLLEKIAPLYVLQGSDSTADFVHQAEQFQLDHAWLKQLTEWVGTSLPEQKHVFEARRDALQPRVMNERGSVYPSGPCLAAVPIEAYAASE